MADILKNNLRLFKLDAKTLLVLWQCYNVIQMTKDEGYPNFDSFNKNFWERPSTNLFMTCDIKPLKPILAQIVMLAQQKRLLKSHFRSFVIKQHGNSWRLRWVNSTILNDEIWLILISWVVFMTILLTCVYEKVIYITFWSVGHWWY